MTNRSEHELGLTQPLAVQLRGLTKTYTMQTEVVNALQTVDLEVFTGENVAVVGPSGSGKSTLMNLIGGLDEPSAGTVIVCGYSLSEMDANQIAAFRNQTIGFVFQQFNLLPRLTARENVALPLLYGRVPRRKRQVRAAELLDRLGLGDRLDHKPSQLSGGQQQRVAIARALICNPPLLLADEPTGSLDSITADEILALLRDLNRQGVTLITVTHDETVAAQADRRVRFRDGQVVSDDRPARPSDGFER